MARPHNERVRRVLFPDNQDEKKNSINILNEELKKDAEIMKEKYNFDFKTDTPCPGNFTWIKTNNGTYDWIGVKSPDDKQNTEDKEKREIVLDENSKINTETICDDSSKTQ